MGFFDGMGSLALMYFLQQKQDGKTPNFYNQPLTPEQKYWDNAAKGIFENSSTRNWINGVGSQYMQGMSDLNPGNYKFISPLMQGQKFAGGVRMPTFDFSKINPLPGTGGNGVPTGPNTGPGMPDPPRTLPGNKGGGMASEPPRALNRVDPEGTSPTLPGPRNPTYNPADNVLPSDWGIAKEDLGRLTSAMSDLAQKYPNATRMGASALTALLTAATGLPGMAVGKFVSNWLAQQRNGGNPTRIPQGTPLDTSGAPGVGGNR